MKKALVFGATGQLGCYSALDLKDHGYDVIAVGRRASDNGFFATREIDFIGGVNIEDKSAYKKLPQKGIDVVVNMAGTMPAHATPEMMPYVQSIIAGTVNVCEWMKKIGCMRIIFNTTPSDVAAYWGTTTPINDDAPRSFPKNGGDHAVYAICKNAAADILENMQITSGFEPCIFRHFMVYGWHPDAIYYINGERRVYPWRQIIRNCIAGNDIEVWGDTKRLKELLYIKDFSNAVVCAAETHSCGIFNLPGKRPYSIEEQIDGLMNAFSPANAKKIYFPDKPNSPQYTLAHGKTEQNLNWMPKWTWEEACIDMRKEMIANPIELMWGKVDEADRIS